MELQTDMSIINNLFAMNQVTQFFRHTEYILQWHTYITYSPIKYLLHMQYICL